MMPVYDVLSKPHSSRTAIGQVHSEVRRRRPCQPLRHTLFPHTILVGATARLSGGNPYLHHGSPQLSTSHSCTFMHVVPGAGSVASA